MFCGKCGKELPDGNVYCHFCGAKVGASEQSNPQTATQDTASVDMKPYLANKTTDKETTMRGIIGQNADYYLTQFGRLQEGGKDKINWASFFLNIYHASYRGVWKEWLHAVKSPLIACLALVVALCVVSAAALFETWMILLLITPVLTIWLFVKQILTAKRFNRMYMAHIEEKINHNDQTSDPSGKRVVVTFLAVMAIEILAFFCMAMSTPFGFLVMLSAASEENPGYTENFYTASDEMQTDMDEDFDYTDNTDTASDEIQTEDETQPDTTDTTGDTTGTPKTTETDDLAQLKKDLDDWADSKEAELDATLPPVEPDTPPSQPVQPSPPPSQPENAAGNELDSVYLLWDQIANDVLSNYVYGLTNAINNGDFSYVSSVFVPNSPIYNEQSGLVKSLFNQGYTEEVIDFYIVSSNIQDTGHGTITSHEEIGVYTPSGDYKVVEQSYTYYLERQSDGGWKMYKMEEAA